MKNIRPSHSRGLKTVLHSKKLDKVCNKVWNKVWNKSDEIIAFSRRIPKKQSAVETQDVSVTSPDISRSQRFIYKYTDQGGHVCDICRLSFDTVSDYCQHLQSTNHKQVASNNSYID